MKKLIFKGSTRRLERQTIRTRGQPTRRRIRRVLVRNALSQVSRKVPARSMAASRGQTRHVQHQSRPGLGRGLDVGAHDSQDLGPVHDREGT